MFKIVEKRPFMSGLLIGFFGVGLIGKGLKKLFKGRITIVHINVDDMMMGDSDNPKEGNSADAKEEPAKGK